MIPGWFYDLWSNYSKNPRQLISWFDGKSGFVKLSKMLLLIVSGNYFWYGFIILMYVASYFISINVLDFSWIREKSSDHNSDFLEGKAWFAGIESKSMVYFRHWIELRKKRIRIKDVRDVFMATKHNAK